MNRKASNLRHLDSLRCARRVEIVTTAARAGLSIGAKALARAIGAHPPVDQLRDVLLGPRVFRPATSCRCFARVPARIAPAGASEEPPALLAPLVLGQGGGEDPPRPAQRGGRGYLCPARFDQSGGLVRGRPRAWPRPETSSLPGLPGLPTLFTSSAAPGARSTRYLGARRNGPLAGPRKPGERLLRPQWAPLPETAGPPAGRPRRPRASPGHQAEGPLGAGSEALRPNTFRVRARQVFVGP